MLSKLGQGKRQVPTQVFGAIEQDADLVMFIHRPEYYDREDDSVRGQADIMLAKNRNGPTGNLRLRFTSEYTRFDSLALREEPS